MINRYSIALILILFLLFSCESPEKGLDQLFPGPGFEKGWSWEGMPKHYSPDTLYEYINGEAELYLTYGFKELAMLNYFYGDSEDSAFVVEIYEMGSAVNAFGLYSNYRRPGYQYSQIGTEAVVSNYSIRFLQGRYVVDLKAADDSDHIRQAMRMVAIKLSDRIDDPAEFPSILGFLPVEGQIEKTVSYQARDMLNQSFLPAGISAQYLISDEEITGFIVFFPTIEDAASGLRQIQMFYQDEGADFIKSDVPGDEGFGVQTKYHGFVIMTGHERYLVGVQDASNTQVGLTLLNRLLGHISSIE